MEFLYAHPFLIGLIAFVIGLVSMPLVIKIARKKHLVVRPNKRTCHTGEIPNIGGVNICFSFLLTFMLFELNSLQESQYLLIGVFVIVIIGLVDDILVLSPLSKLIGEVFAGVVLIGFADIRLSNLHGLFGVTEMGILASYGLSFFLLLAIINALNLIDGVDGLASGLGMLYCAFFSIYFLRAGEIAWAILGICLIGSLAVFFFYNVFGKQQKIFLGDSGSLLLGYMMTAFVFHMLEMNAYHLVPEKLQMSAAPMVALAVLTVPMFDMARVSITRIVHGKSPFQADKNHIHHLLLRTGLNHLQTTGVLMVVSLLFIGLAILGRNWNMWLLLSCDAAGFCLFIGIIRWVIKHKEKADNDKH